MSTSNNKILKIYKSRKTILEILGTKLGYQVADYDNFSINEIDAMATTNQLDMLLTNKTTKQKTYIKYHVNKSLRPQNLDNIIEDLFFVEAALEKTDNLIIIVEEEPNETLRNKLEYLFNKDGIFVVIHNIHRLQYNILEHDLVPDIEILPADQYPDFQKRYNLKALTQLPQISRFDPMALIMCLRPGQILEIMRDSMTALKTKYYRICV